MLLPELLPASERSRNFKPRLGEGIAHRFVREHQDTAFIQEPYQVKHQIITLTGELDYNISG